MHCLFRVRGWPAHFMTERHVTPVLFSDVMLNVQDGGNFHVS
jgi:hypothetical protein